MSPFMFTLVCVLYILVGLFFTGFLCGDDNFDAWCASALFLWPLFSLVLVAMWIAYPIFKLGKKAGKRFMIMENKLLNKED